MDGSFRSRWRTEVFSCPLVTPTVRLTLLALGEYMKPSGYVSVPLTEIAAMVGRDNRRVLEHYAAAIKAGLLARVSYGHEGRTAVYRACFPDPERVTESSTLSLPRNRHPLQAQEGAENRHPTGRGLVTERRSLAHANGWEKYALDERSA